MILLDTNAISEMARHPHSSLAQRVLTTPPDQRATSVIVAAEIEYGLAKKPEATTLAATMRGLLAQLHIHELPTEAASVYGQLRAAAEQAGRPVDGNDLLIAAHAVVLDATVLTNNRRHFDHVIPGRVEGF